MTGRQEKTGFVGLPSPVWPLHRLSCFYFYSDMARLKSTVNGSTFLWIFKCLMGNGNQKPGMRLSIVFCLSRCFCAISCPRWELRAVRQMPDNPTRSTSIEKSTNRCRMDGHCPIEGGAAGRRHPPDHELGRRRTGMGSRTTQPAASSPLAKERSLKSGD